MKNAKNWSIILITVIVALALVHWYTTTRPDSFFNTYGWNSVSTSTPATDDAYATSTDTTPTPTPAAPNSSNTTSQTPIQANNNQTNMKNFSHLVMIETSKGTITFETYDADAPNTVKNFMTLADKSFYNGVIFHRVIKDFMIQGGDPTGTGTGGPGYAFADELNPATPSYKTGYVRGAVAMANAGPNTNGSQFFIMHKDVGLEHNYTIFGRVVSGMDVVDAIANTQTGAGDRPVEKITMNKVTVAEKK